MGPGLDGDQGLRATPVRRVGGPAPAAAGRRLQLALLLAAPLGWLVIAYLGSLAVLFVAAFWQLDPFTAEIVKEYALDNFETLVNERRLPRRSRCARS